MEAKNFSQTTLLLKLSNSNPHPQDAGFIFNARSDFYVKKNA